MKPLLVVALIAVAACTSTPPPVVREVWTEPGRTPDIVKMKVAQAAAVSEADRLNAALVPSFVVRTAVRGAHRPS